jgi:hypothetical protein
MNLKFVIQKMIRSDQKKKTKKNSLKDFILLIGSKLIDIYFEISDPFCLISSYYHYLNKPKKNQIQEKIAFKNKNKLITQFCFYLLKIYGRAKYK